MKVLGATVVSVDPVPYPFQVTKTRASENKPCRYSKLSVWRLTQFTRVAFLDADTLVVGPVDDLLDVAGLAAVPDGPPCHALVPHAATRHTAPTCHQGQGL
jgi:alpha-N-acetylglucosamine transferase